MKSQPGHSDIEGLDALPVVCWMVACQGCESDEVESEGPTHYQSRAEAEEGIARAGWRIVDGAVRCPYCPGGDE